MDAIFFGLKRAHQRTVRFEHEVLAEYGLTPARFDMLFAIREYGIGSISQRELRRLLGVARPTVSRMLRSLERLRFVRRDARRYTRRVSLTALGCTVTRRATKRVFHSGFARRAAARMIRLAEGSNDFEQRDLLDSIFRTIRRRLGDTATLHYRWHPDD